MKKHLYHLPDTSTQVSITIGHSLLKNDLFLKTTLEPIGKKFALISDSNVSPLVSQPLNLKLQSLGFTTEIFDFPAGEASKSRATKEAIEDALFLKGYGKDCAIIAIGGGVVTDMAGYTASTFCRGVPLVSIPTSLLAMVDAAIGGKTGVNTPFGKNLIGSIYQPQHIIMDIETLDTLPEDEMRQGMAECIKHGAILSAPYFEFIMSERTQLVNKDHHALEKLIYESCLIKSTIVEEDVSETGKRRILNFGHTFAHAFETISNYQLSHGDAVALGMLLESRLFIERGELSLNSYNELSTLLKSYNFPLVAPRHTVEELIKIMLADKKTKQGLPRFAGISAIGSPLPFAGQYCTSVSIPSIEKALSHDLHSS